jgi:hypothetical protein
MHNITCNRSHAFPHLLLMTRQNLNPENRNVRWNLHKSCIKADPCFHLSVRRKNDES